MHRTPQILECRDTFQRGVAGEPGPIPGADGGADDDVGANITLEQCPQRADLKRATRGPAGEHKGGVIAPARQMGGRREKAVAAEMTVGGVTIVSIEMLLRCHCLFSAQVVARSPDTCFNTPPLSPPRGPHA